MSETANDLRGMHCAAAVQRLGKAQIAARLRSLPKWSRHTGRIVRTFEFCDYYDTIAFVNALAWLAHREDHHPELHVTYAQCRVAYRTDSVDGLSDNDFICAAKVDALFES